MKITIREDFRVEVVPITLHSRLTDEQLAAHLEEQCREIKQQIDRHVDYTRSISVRWASREVCGFCRQPTEELTEAEMTQYPELLAPGDGPGLPQCCEAAQVEWRAAQTAVTQ